MKPWLARRPLFGQYETLFQELDQQSAGDYIGFIRTVSTCGVLYTYDSGTSHALQKYVARTEEVRSSLFFKTRTLEASATYEHLA